MKKSGYALDFWGRRLVVSAVSFGLLLACGAAPDDDAQTETACLASASWVAAPNPPSEIGGGVPVGEETNCQFQQFAWQWFLSLVSPAGGESGEREFETFPILQADQENQCAGSPAVGRAELVQALFVRDGKQDESDFQPVLPERIAQAGTEEVLYDQNGNVVFYAVQYNPVECQATSAGFEPNTIELKTSWRQLASDDPNLSRYYTLTATIPEVSPDPLTLGLVGFHLVINTAHHPEFVWATFEHADNAPDCNNPSAPPAAGWSFLSAECAECLAENGLSACADCKFNQGVESTSLTGTPNEVCRVFPDGTDPDAMTGGNDNDTNRANIGALNRQLVGPDGYLTALPADDPMAVWKNYFLVGSLWTEGGVGSKQPDAQRGSLELANLTMETFFQQSNRNCFTCHVYDPANPLDVSHIISSLLPSSGG